MLSNNQVRKWTISASGFLLQEILVKTWCKSRSRRIISPTSSPIKGYFPSYIIHRFRHLRTGNDIYNKYESIAMTTAKDRNTQTTGNRKEIY